MPELPEVETIKRDLEKLLAGKVVRKVQINDPFVLTGFSPKGAPRRKVSTETFKKNILGKRIRCFNRRGKYLIMEFLDRSALIFHLRMTGQLLIQKSAGQERAVFFFNDETSLCFIDRRRFGEVEYSSNWLQYPAFRSLGIEPLNGKLNASFLKQAFQHRTASVHSVLLNQKIVSGIGNIYANEALFRAGIRPDRSAGKITSSKLGLLCDSIRDVLNQSILNRGYSMSTYVDALGAKGRSQMFSSVYGKEGQPCGRCGKSLIRKVVSGRGTVYCSFCQK